jgi:hypothetical protein
MRIFLDEIVEKIKRQISFSIIPPPTENRAVYGRMTDSPQITI